MGYPASITSEGDAAVGSSVIVKSTSQVEVRFLSAKLSTPTFSITPDLRTRSRRRRFRPGGSYRNLRGFHGSKPLTPLYQRVPKRCPCLAGAASGAKNHNPSGHDPAPQWYIALKLHESHVRKQLQACTCGMFSMSDFLQLQMMHAECSNGHREVHEKVT